ncbi:hypothetical protein BDF14DRAFT_1424311 [Spinellus fusiger]|nr:hypothetical protein BDF14DRAFT_1424311 [Spinellus fusiger]
MSTHSVYLFRHIQSNQVLVSTRPNMKSKSLSQLNLARPIRLRKDLWRPVVALTGFDSEKAVRAVQDALLHRSKAYQLTLATDKEHLTRPKRLRSVDEKDILKTSIVSLREALESVSHRYLKEDGKLTALWEQTQHMELKGDSEWPAFLEHGQLALKNNRFVSEQEEKE